MSYGGVQKERDGSYAPDRCVRTTDSSPPRSRWFSEEVNDCEIELLEPLLTGDAVACRRQASGPERPGLQTPLHKVPTMLASAYLF
jgi:hypothetical protein